MNTEIQFEIIDDCIESTLTNEILSCAHENDFAPARMQSAGRYNGEMFLRNSSLMKKLAVAASRHGLDVDCNVVLEVYRYCEGQYIAPHIDASQIMGSGWVSSATLPIYLNHEFDGGRTVFLSPHRVVTPKRGRGVVFAHGLIHEAEPVLRGMKFVARVNVRAQGVGTRDERAPTIYAG